LCTPHVCGGAPTMGAVLEKLFIDPETLIGCDVPEGDACWNDPDFFYGLVQVSVLGLVYGNVLMTASNILSDGSELLLLVPSVAGIVGSVVLPTLGAVPDAVIMLFSGLGPVEEAQEEISVGIGALAGSTIMLLTIPWSVATAAGAVPIEGGSCNYKRRKATTFNGASLCVDGGLLWTFGVEPDSTIRSNAYIMLLTSISYLIIQGPAFAYATSHADDKESVLEGKQHWWALAALISSLLLLVAYLCLMVSQSNSSEAKDHTDRVILQHLKDGDVPISLSGVVGPLLQAQVASHASPSRKSLGDALLGEEKRRLARLLHPFFHKYDIDGNGSIDFMELRLLLSDLHEKVSAEEAKQWMDKMDPDGSGNITEEEFVDAMLSFVSEMSMRSIRASAEGEEEDDDDEDDEDEDADMPEEALHLSPAEQQRYIIGKSVRMMLFGTALIVLFSDPLVSVLSTLGKRVGIPAFYIAFVLAPLASNGSEFIASYNYATKKTRKTITISLSALEGAACMNNTFCLAVFMGLVYFRGLVWEFTAETLVILLCQVFVACIAVQRVQTLWMAIIALALMPLSLAFVAALEAYGFD